MTNSSYDVIVIGGGVVGCAVARELTKFSLKTALLEKAVDICAGQSKANTAIIHGGYDAKPGTKKAYYNVLGNKMFGKVCEELDVPHEWNGSLVVSFAPDQDDKIVELYERGQKNGVPGLGIIKHDKIMQREPNINPEARLALDVQNGGICCPYELTVAFAENASKNGADFFRSSPVKNVYRKNEMWYVETVSRVFECKAVINCAGMYSDEIHNMVSKDRLSIHPRRGEYYLIDKKYASAFHSAIFQVPGKMGKGILIARTVDGTTLVGPTAEDIDDKDDTRTTADGLAKALAGAKITWPQLPTRAFITTFSGLRSHCDRDDFVIGEVPDAPLFFDAAGVESPGLTSSPAIGLELAEMVAEALHAGKNPKFDPIRKGIPKFRELSNERRSQLIANNADFAKVVCRCETVTEAEIRDAIRRPVGALTVDGVKIRTRAGMGRCQAGFCTPRVLEILSEELNIPLEEVRKFGGDSRYVYGKIFDKAEAANE
ncbi:MAG: NAD(P)/FAD-dependent oxidoreductase [Anaerolineaceae bacterium]|nr:NAD(P)/FAD-dependent oxidoreductase [Anaerolineaceae bacterium]